MWGKKLNYYQNFRRIRRWSKHRVKRTIVVSRRFLSLGARGERIAGRYLQKRKFIIRERNWRCPIGEIDIIAQDNNTLTFIEVKTRRAEIAKDFIPSDAVDEVKQEKLRRLANWYTKDNRGDLRYKRIRNIRFDIASVIIYSPIKYEIQVERGAF